MNSDKSISQGVFLTLPPGFSVAKLRRRKKHKTVEENLPLWEKSFSKIWKIIEFEMKDMSEKLYGKVLAELVSHIGNLKWEEHSQGALPCELLLTGTNLPDHKLLLDALTKKLKASTTDHVATLWAGESTSIRLAVQSLVKQIIDNDNFSSESEDSEEEYEEETRKRKKHSKMPASQLSLGTLSAWYQEQNTKDKKPVVIILPDFESFSSSVLSDFISLLCAFDKNVAFVLVFGVATSPSAVYQSLPRAILSRLVIQLFHSEASPTFLNHVIEKVFLNEKCPFRLGGKTMTFLTDVFLFHSFSVQRFVQGFKYCMTEHFYLNDHMALCCTEDQIEDVVDKMSTEAIERLRRFKSFRKHVESCDLPERRNLLTNDNHTKEFTIKKLKALQSHISDFHTVLKCLNFLARDLPNAPLGKQVRELYCMAVSSEVVKSEDYKRALSLLEMQAKTELASKIDGVLDILKINNILDILSEDQIQFDPVIAKLEKVKKDLDQMGQQSPETNGDLKRKDPRKDLINALSEDLFEPFLIPPTTLTLHEIIYFDDLPAVRRRIAGAPKSAIHNALNNPHHYLECDCCELPNADAVISSLPDISIAYKLYLESNRTIKLDDWLKSFIAVINPESDGKSNGVDQQLQLRFRKAVSELQFLGFIKPSKTNQNQVTKLTFGSF